MNQREKNIFFSLVRHALWGKALSPSEWGSGWSWKPIMTEVEAHALQTLLAESILSLPDSYRPAASTQARLTQILALNIRKHNVLNGDIVRIFGAMEGSGLSPILMKGQSLTSYYPQPFFRKCGDVDLFVGEDGFESALRVMEDMGARRKENDLSEKHVTFALGETEVEVHRFAEQVVAPQNDSAYQSLVREYRSLPGKVEVGGAAISAFPSQFLPVYLFNHIWHHFKEGGIGLRQFCDLALVLHGLSCSLDRERMEADLSAVDLLREWRLVGALLVNRMGLPASEYPCYEEMDDKKAERLADLVLGDGNFAAHWNFNVDFGSSIVKKIHSWSIHTRRYYRLARVSFPIAFRTYVAWFRNRFHKTVGEV